MESREGVCSVVVYTSRKCRSSSAWSCDSDAHQPIPFWDEIFQQIPFIGSARKWTNSQAAQDQTLSILSGSSANGQNCTGRDTAGEAKRKEAVTHVQCVSASVR